MLSIGSPHAGGRPAVLGLAGSIALTRVMRDILFQVNPADPVVLSGVTLLLLAVAMCASLIPAHRATRIGR